MKEILRGIELSKEFYFKPNKPPNLSDFINDSDNEMKFEIDDDFILKINDFNFITVYLFDDFYLNQFNRNNDEVSELEKFNRKYLFLFLIFFFLSFQILKKKMKY